MKYESFWEQTSRAYLRYGYFCVFFGLPSLCHTKADHDMRRVYFAYLRPYGVFQKYVAEDNCHFSLPLRRGGYTCHVGSAFCRGREVGASALL